MNAIIGLGYLALQTDLTPCQYDYLTKMASAADGLLKLLNDLLDLSKIEAGRMELEEHTFQLGSVLEQLKSLMGAKAIEKGLLLRVDIHPSTPEYLVGDSLRLRQLLLNLVSNAIKFTSQGEVALSVFPLAKGEKENILEFSVRDSGIGMTREQLTTIFDPFIQADNTTTRRYGGTGLGLNICQRFAALMGGSVRVESEPGRGTTFTFAASFLTGSADDVEEAHFSPEDKMALRGCRILVAEDHPINQQVIRELLEQAGAIVTIVGDGRQAVAAVERKGSEFDVVLMDIQMPHMDGYEATRLIRESFPSDRLHIVAMTAHAFAEERERCREAGMNDHLTKPVRPEAVYACLARWYRPTAAQTRTEVNLEAQPEEPEQFPGFDTKEGILNFSGNTPLYKLMAAQFIRSHGDDAARIAATLAAGNNDQARLLAHALKGVAGTLAAVRVYRIATDLESALKGGEQDAASLLPELTEALLEIQGSPSASARVIPTLTVIPPPDRGRVILLLEELLPLLLKRKLAALKIMKRLTDSLEGTTMGGEAADLAEAVDRLDFSTAYEQASRLAGRLVPSSRTGQPDDL